MIAALLGVLQGILTLLGGIIACFDKKDNVFFLEFHREMIEDGLPELMNIARKIPMIVLQGRTLFN